MSKPWNLLRRLYHTSVPLTWKYGKPFRHALFEYEKSLTRSREEIEDYQWSCLTALIDYCYQHVPYYRRVFAKAQLTPADIHHRSDLERIPVLTKEDVDRYRDELKSDEFETFNPIATVTSATTRDGLLLYRSQGVEAHRHAVVWRFYRSIGYSFRQPRARLTTPFRRDLTPDQFPVDLNENCLYIHPHAINRELAPEVYRQLKDFRPRMLQVQPASATMLAKYCEELGLGPLEIPLIVSIGELLYPEYRTIIERFFGGVVYNYYANRENTAAAGTDAAGNLLIYSDYCYLEFDPETEFSSRAVQGNIISTSLHNYAFPLLRYHTEDLGRYHGYQIDSPYPFPAMEVIGGRGKDLLLTREGLKLPYVISVLKRNDLIVYDRVQLEQLSLDEIIVRIVPSRYYDDSRDRALIEKAYVEEFKGEFKVHVEIVEKIESSGGGKYRMVISHLAMESLRQAL